jgi:uncharacterized LabA/DUF88 family protein
LRTIAYIDGYNLYYGLLRGSTYKWLDIVTLIENILHIQDPDSELICVKFFTAPVLAKYARHGADSVAAQSPYLRATTQIHGDKFQPIMGRHSPEKEWLPAVVNDAPLNREDKHHVWTLNEKKTDVNLTVHMYRDCMKPACDQVILVSNDSDFEPLLSALRSETEIRIGLVTPLPKVDDKPYRRPSVSLAKNAHWVRTHVLNAELEVAQLKSVVPTNKKAIRKPSYW